jgi:hypothetical protein
MFGVIEPFAAPASITVFEKGGYTVIREKDTAETETLLVFDHAPLGYLSIAAHGHADSLSIWLHRNGIPVLVDAGTYLYHAGKEWRSHFRSTPAHNTLCINNTDSSTISGAFNWAQKAKTKLISYNSMPDFWVFSASHDGYKKSMNAIHERTLKKMDSKSFRLTDRITRNDLDTEKTYKFSSFPEVIVHILMFIAEGLASFFSSRSKKQLYPTEIGFLLHPDVTFTQEEKLFTLSLNEKPLLKIQYTGSLESHCENGQQNPLRGWYSPAFGVRHPTTRLVFKGDIANNQPQEFVFTVF